MNETLHLIQTSLGRLGPELCLFVGIMLLTLQIAFTNKPTTKRTFRVSLWITITILLFTLVLAFIRLDTLQEASELMLGKLYHDKHTLVFQCLILLGSLVALLHVAVMSYHTSAEYFFLFLSIVLGSMFLSTSYNFMTMFVSLELVSICSYALIAIERKKKNYESAIKYLTVGSIISAVMLYAISLIYGATGTLQFESLSSLTAPTFSIVFLLVFSGLLFKLTAVPFHTWAPDVYESAPIPVLSFLSIVPKIAAFVLLVRVIPENAPLLSQSLSILILLSITIGNFAALRQSDAKRLMAYSGIAHAGFISIGLLSIGAGGKEASLFYLAVYLIMNLSAFLVIDLLKRYSGSTSLSSFSGLGSRYALLGVLTIVVMISLVGLPPAAGFSAKFLIFTSIIKKVQNGDLLALSILVFGLINTAVSLFYYLKIPYFMFVKESTMPPENSLKPKSSLAAMVLLSVLTFTLLIIFFKPSIVLSLF